MISLPLRSVGRSARRVSLCVCGGSLARCLPTNFFCVLCYSPASSLTCVCKEYLGSDLPVTNVNCYSNATCDTTTGRCFVDLRLVELQGKILHKYIFGCVENSARDWPAFSLVHTTCEAGFATTTQVVLCCNDTDLCNQRLEPHLHLATVTAMAPSPTPAGNIHPTSTPSGYEEGMIVHMYVILYYTIYELYTQYIHKFDSVCENETERI